MQGMMIWLAVAAGGAIGALMRYGVSVVTARLVGDGFPWATVIVNISGSFLMGVLVAWLVAKDPQTLVLRAFLAVGILGAFTTFSTFSLDFVTLIERKEMFAAGGYLVASVLVSIIALVGGLAAGRAAL